MSLQEEMAAASPAVNAALGGMDMRQILSTGLSALPADSNGVPFNMSHIYASGNIAADMYCNVAAEATGRRNDCLDAHTRSGEFITTLRLSPTRGRAVQLRILWSHSEADSARWF